MCRELGRATFLNIETDAGGEREQLG